MFTDNDIDSYQCLARSNHSFARRHGFQYFILDSAGDSQRHDYDLGLPQIGLHFRDFADDLDTILLRKLPYRGSRIPANDQKLRPGMICPNLWPHLAAKPGNAVDVGPVIEHTNEYTMV